MGNIWDTMGKFLFWEYFVFTFCQSFSHHTGNPLSFYEQTQAHRKWGFAMHVVEAVFFLTTHHWWAFHTRWSSLSFDGAWGFGFALAKAKGAEALERCRGKKQKTYFLLFWENEGCSQSSVSHDFCSNCIADFPPQFFLAKISGKCAFVFVLIHGQGWLHSKVRSDFSVQFFTYNFWDVSPVFPQIWYI